MRMTHRRAQFLDKRPKTKNMATLIGRKRKMNSKELKSIDAVGY
jgi:hypothetical protein